MVAANEQPVKELVEHLFRHESGAMLAWLCRVFGLKQIDLAEEVVQDTMLQALRQWSFAGVPAEPAAWLRRTARNRAIDILRRQSAFHKREPVLAEMFEARQQAAGAATLDDPIADDQLAMMFASCHPAIPADARVALTLKTVSGFSVVEIARAFLMPQATIAQRLVRAKRLLVESGIELSVPPAAELGQRLDSVLQALYLVFNEGYTAHHGEDLVRQDLCSEAVRLAQHLAGDSSTARPKVHALLALMLLQGSRLPARVDARGDLLLLPAQDRTLWDTGLIAEGMRHLEESSTGDELTTYHIQAAIAAVHAASPRHEDTDWHYLVDLYDQLDSMEPSPIVRLNRAVALGMASGPDAGLSALAAIENDRSLANYYLLPAVRADMLVRLGRFEEAAANYRRALELPCSEPERRFLARRLEACGVPSTAVDNA
jgi:RNA polymerase sigma factor (sigma-70 family)